MQERIIGRHNELQLLAKYMQTPRSEFIAVYGRRRVGKTFLVRHAIGKEACFSVTGMEHVLLDEQLANFYISLRKVYPSAVRCGSWLEAFDQLEQYLESLQEGNKILFFDELPWFDTPRSNFVSALEHFWNNWASARSDIKLVTCGSAASWMLDHLINNHGGLHNRVTHQMLIEPFSLKECKEYFDAYDFGYQVREVAEYYMVFGGVPYYLSLMNRDESVAQNVDRLIFSATGELSAERTNLFRSLFKRSADYVTIVEALSAKRKGWLYKLVVHWLEHSTITVHHHLHGSASLLRVARDIADKALVGIRIHEYLDVHHIAQTPIDQRHYSLDDDDWLWLHMNGLWQTVADEIGISRLFDSLSCTQFAYLLDEEFPVEGIRMVEIDCLALFVCQIGGVIII